MPKSNNAALAAFFFTYFAFIGAVNPYFSLWLKDQGFSFHDIGILLAIPPAMRLIGSTSWGRLADKTGQRVKWIRLMAHCSVAGMLVVGLSPYWGTWAFAGAVLGLVMMHAMLSGQIPLTESLLLQKIGANLKDYGPIRLYGSLGFVVAVLLFGPLLDYLGTQWLMPLGAGILLIHIAVSWQLRDANPPKKPNITEQEKDHSDSTSLLQILRRPHIKLFLIASFLMIFGHMGLYIYFSLYLEAAGFSKTMIGFLWALSAIAEIGYFWMQPRLKSSAVTGYTRSYWLAAVRFGALAWLAIPLGSPVWLLAVLQCAHMGTFALHHAASMVLLKQLFPANAGSTANALFNTVSYGLAGSVGALACAWVWQHFSALDAVAHSHIGAQAVFTMGAISCALGGLAAWRLRLRLKL